jgi:hypothetical protein
VLRGAQEAVRGLLEVLHADPVVGRQDAARECSHVGVVTGVVLIHQGTEPAVVTLGYSLPWLPFSQLRPLGHHLRQAPQDEVELDRHRLLAPQRAVVVEHRNPFLWWQSRRSVRTACTGHEVHDRPPGRAVTPAR